MGVHGENPPLMKTRKQLLLKKRDYYGKNCEMKVGKKLIKNGEEILQKLFLISENK